jgi:hypothetical protein
LGEAEVKKSRRREMTPWVPLVSEGREEGWGVLDVLRRHRGLR